MWSADKSIIGVLANVWLMWDTLMVIANSYGVVIHSMALQPSSENIRGVLGQFIRKSFVRSLLVCLVVSVIPDDVFSSIFGWEFSNMNRYFILIVPTILLSAICSPIAHWLHANNRFFELFRIYLSAVIVYVSFIVFGLFFPGIVYCIKLNVKGFIEELFSNRSFYSSDLVVVNWEVVALFPAFFCMFLLLLRSLRRTE
jgi:O-antigen/teichoic acid export membrane protein